MSLSLCLSLSLSVSLSLYFSLSFIPVLIAAKVGGAKGTEAEARIELRQRPLVREHHVELRQVFLRTRSS
jgi:hypothetical protein